MYLVFQPVTENACHKGDYVIKEGDLLPPPRVVQTQPYDLTVGNFSPTHLDLWGRGAGG